MSATSIEWATHVFNPFTGCDRVSPGCARCYALSYAGRLKGMGKAKYQNDGDPRTSGPGFGFTVHEQLLAHPPRFPVGARVFVNSMSDVFHEQATDRDIARVFAAAAAQPWADFLILTKRPERMQQLVGHREFAQLAGDCLLKDHGPRLTETSYAAWPILNVWLGVSIENRRFVHRADLLRETPAAVRFISAEPLLGSLTDARCICCGYGVAHYDLCFVCANDGCSVCGPEPAGYGEGRNPYREFPDDRLSLQQINWLIVGGESGARARPCKPEWVRDLRDVAQASGTAFFFKQWGGRTPKAGGRELDGRTWDEFPRAGAVLAASGRGGSEAVSA